MTTIDRLINGELTLPDADARRVLRDARQRLMVRRQMEKRARIRMEHLRPAAKDERDAHRRGQHTRGRAIQALYDATTAHQRAVERVREAEEQAKAALREWTGTGSEA